jgi:hypothetical protein
MSLLSDFAGLGQLGTALALFLRSQDLPAPMRENRMLSVFGIWLGGSMVRSGLTKTGAFEVYLGQKQVWSAIKKGGETPKMKELVEAFKAVGVTINQ